MNHYENFLAGEYTTVEHITPEVYKNLKENGVTDTQMIKALKINTTAFYKHKSKYPEMKNFNLPKGVRGSKPKQTKLDIPLEATPIVEETSVPETTSEERKDMVTEFDTIESKLRIRLESLLGELAEANDENYTLRKRIDELHANPSSPDLSVEYQKLKEYCEYLEAEIERYKQFEKSVQDDNIVDGLYHKEKIEAYNSVIMGLIKIAEID